MQQNTRHLKSRRPRKKNRFGDRARTVGGYLWPEDERAPSLWDSWQPAQGNNVTTVASTQYSKTV
eukprot:11204100-Lingulodinium_polyedra.AAC.1